jgi:hypothetical protein
MFTSVTIRTMRQQAACLVVAIWLLATTVIPAGAQDRVRVTIQNASRYDIYQIHMSRSGDASWRRDLLADGILASGDSFALSATEGTYDLKLVDEDGDICTVTRIRLYDNQSWRITDSWLLGCEFH